MQAPAEDPKNQETIPTFKVSAHYWIDQIKWLYLIVIDFGSFH